MSRLISTCFTNTLNPPPGPKPPPPAVECLLHVLAAAPPRRGARSFRGGRAEVAARCTEVARSFRGARWREEAKGFTWDGSTVCGAVGAKRLEGI